MDGNNKVTGVTGCPHGYECLIKNNTVAMNGYLRMELQNNNNIAEIFHNEVDNNKLYCHRIDPDYDGEKPKPLVLPRYKLTNLPHKVFTQVYGLPLAERTFPASGANDEMNENGTNKKDSEGKNKVEKNVAYFSSMGSLDSSHKSDLQLHQRVTTVLIVVHGSGRTAEDYLYGAVSSLPKDQQDFHNATTMVISPWFLDPEDDDVDAAEFIEHNDNMLGEDADERSVRVGRRRLGHDKRHHHHRHPEGKNNIPIPLPPNTLRWYEMGPELLHTWRYGANAINSTLSSFDAMDRLVERFVDDPVRFPSLARILVTGHSAGGQFVQRWTMVSDSPVWKEPSYSSDHHDAGDVEVTGDSNYQYGTQRKLVTQRNVQLRAVPANPRCFAMLDDRRYVHDAKTNTTVFRRPDNAAIDACPDFNQWIWGLDPGGSVVAPYKDRAVAAAGGARSLAHRYVTQRNVVYLAGGADLEVFDDDCGSVIQGQTRRERSQKFMASLQEVYPQEMKNELHTRVVAMGIPHDHTLMFQSPAGQEALFGDKS